jgi:hypothetical protein
MRSVGTRPCTKPPCYKSYLAIPHPKSQQITMTQLNPNSANYDNENNLPIRLISILFIGQIVAILLTLLYYFSYVDTAVWPQLELNQPLPPETAQALDDFTVVLFYLTPITLLLVIATLGVLFLWSLGWVFGMLAQCAILLVCLSFYFFHPLTAIYPLMLGAILMVFILNLNFVRLRLLRQWQQERLHIFDDSTPLEE